MSARTWKSASFPKTQSNLDSAPERDGAHRPVAAALEAMRGVPSRRDVLRGLTGVWIGLGLASVPGVGEAKPERRKKRPGSKPAKRNKYGCLDVNVPCRRGTQCCSRVCAGKPGKKRCRPHHAGQCKPSFDGCAGLVAVCGDSGHCFRTTGKASFCGGSEGSMCVDCKRDIDSQKLIGPGAACVVCPACAGKGSKGTACYSTAA